MIQATGDNRQSLPNLASFFVRCLVVKDRNFPPQRCSFFGALPRRLGHHNMHLAACQVSEPQSCQGHNQRRSAKLATPTATVPNMLRCLIAMAAVGTVTISKRKSKPHNAKAPSLAVRLAPNSAAKTPTGTSVNQYLRGFGRSRFESKTRGSARGR